jgi:hypothetical protein
MPRQGPRRKPGSGGHGQDELLRAVLEAQAVLADGGDRLPPMRPPWATRWISPVGSRTRRCAFGAREEATRVSRSREASRKGWRRPAFLGGAAQALGPQAGADLLRLEGALGARTRPELVVVGRLGLPCPMSFSWGRGRSGGAPRARLCHAARQRRTVSSLPQVRGRHPARMRHAGRRKAAQARVRAHRRLRQRVAPKGRPIRRQSSSGSLGRPCRPG